MSNFVSDISQFEVSPSSLGMDELEDWKLGQASVWSIIPRTIPRTPDSGACCSGEWPSLTCSITTSAGCFALGGHYLGNGTSCSGVNCNQGVCCQFSGGCALVSFPELCGDCAIGHSCWRGYGETCDSIRCTGPCCVACESECPGFPDCSCYDNLTYSECSAYFSGSCSTAWLLNGGSCGGIGFSNFCCTSFANCYDNCVQSGNCCCNGSIVCGSAQSEGDCNDACGVGGGTFLGILPVKNQCTACGPNPCITTCCAPQSGCGGGSCNVCLDMPVYGGFCDDYCGVLGTATEFCGSFNEPCDNPCP